MDRGNRADRGAGCPLCCLTIGTIARWIVAIVPVGARDNRVVDEHREPSAACVAVGADVDRVQSGRSCRSRSIDPVGLIELIRVTELLPVTTLFRCDRFNLVIGLIGLIMSNPSI